MPETAVDKDHLATGGEDEVRLTGEVAAVEAEAIAEAVGEGADEPLGGGALGADAGHMRSERWDGVRVSMVKVVGFVKFYAMQEASLVWCHADFSMSLPQGEWHLMQQQVFEIEIDVTNQTMTRDGESLCGDICSYTNWTSDTVTSEGTASDGLIHRKVIFDRKTGNLTILNDSRTRPRIISKIVGTCKED